MNTIQVADASNNVISVNVLPPLGQANNANSLPVTPATDSQYQPSYITPTNLAANTWADLRKFNSAWFFITGLTANNVVTINRSGDQVNSFSLSVFDQNGNGPYSNVTANNIYSVIGAAYVNWNQTGTGANVLYSASQ